MYIRERLSEITKTVYLKSASDAKDLVDFYEVYDETLRSHGQKMQEFSPHLLDTLLSILTSLDTASQEVIRDSGDHTRKLVSTFDNLSASFPVPATGNQSFVKFLWTLSKGDELFTEQNVLKDYDKYIDLMETLSWLFQLERDGQLIYPISNLLTDRILREFDPNSEEDLLYLIASLQLFNQLRDIPSDRRDTVLNLSLKYNLKILDMLCDRGRLLFGNSRRTHMEKNKIMGVRSGNKILIRTTDLLRKAPPGTQFEYERNGDGKPIAKFYIYELKAGEVLSSLDSYIRDASAQQTLDVFLKCLEDRAYNVFMQDSLIYNDNNRTFVRWVNPFVSYDPVIIPNCSYQRIEGGENQFFSLLDDRTSFWLRSAPLVQSDLDRMTIDYIIGFYESVCKPLNISARSILCEDTSVWKQEFSRRKDQFAQNLVVKSFFDHVLNHNLDIPTAIRSYTNFAKLNYLSGDTITAETRLIFPYAFYMPFENETELLTAILKSKGETVTNGRLVTLTCKHQTGWSVRGVPGQFTVRDISTLEDLKPLTSFTEYTGLMGNSKNVYILFTPEDRSILKAFRDLRMLLNDLVITENNRSDYDASLPRADLEQLMFNIGMPSELTKLYFPGAFSNPPALKQLSPLLFFKILHHINCYQITPDKLEKWSKLIFHHHLVAPSYSSDPMYNSYRDGVNARSKDGNCLMISKRSYADKSTLGAILNNTKERFAADRAFDAGAINQRIEYSRKTQRYHFVENKKSCIEWKEPIESIVFLTDNIMSGKSTYEMLDYHFHGQPSSDSSRYYMTLDPEKTVLKIIQKNHPRIELHTVFWFTSLCGCTVHPMDKDGFYPVDYPLSDTNKITFYVKAYQSYPPEAYLYTQEAFELARDIYTEPKIPAHKTANERKHLVFRFNNMPAFSVFPREAQTILNKAGLFERR